MILWRDELSVGFEAIDDDHRELVDIINRFEQDIGVAAARRTAQELNRFALHHFTREEAIQQACGYPAREYHRQQHAELMRQLERVSGALDEQARSDAGHGVPDMVSLVRRWILHHILQSDTLLKPYVAPHASLAEDRPAFVRVSTHRTIFYADVSVLIIDDVQFQRMIITRMLRSLGFTDVREAADGAAGLDSCVRSWPDLIICDIGMSPINGLAFLRMLQAEEKRQGAHPAPVVYLTGHNDSASVIEAKKLGAAGYLIKPVKITDLVRRIDSALVRFTSTHSGA